VDDLEWFTTTGAPMTDADWDDPSARCVSVYLDARSVAPDDDLEIPDDDLLVLINGWWEETTFRLPEVGPGGWVEELQTFDPDAQPASLARTSAVVVAPRSIVVLRGQADRG
jgi:glycogen operon protein